VEKAALNPFFRYLSHDSVVVQIPYLRKNARTKGEEFLEIFDQSNVMPNDAHYLMLDNIDNKPDGYNVVVRQLVSAVADREVKMAMAIEDEYASDIEDRVELEEIVEEQKDTISQQKKQLSAFAKTLFSMGLSRKDISEKINIPLEQLNQLLDS
jgi:DNA-binding transcriptional regulator LsrR (DeoR family)